MRQADIRRVALWLLIASVVVTAAIAIWAVALGDFDETTGRILGTSVSLAGGSLVALAAATGWERIRPAAVIGIAGSVIGFGLLIIAIWTSPDPDWYWKTTTSAIVAGVTGAWIALLGNARLAAEHRWIEFVATTSAVILAGLVLVAIWGEIDESGFGRVIGVAAVVVAAMSVVVPVMHRLDAVPAEDVDRPVDVYRFCPACGAPAETRSREATRCEACGAGYRIDSAG